MSTKVYKANNGNKRTSNEKNGLTFDHKNQIQNMNTIITDFILKLFQEFEVYVSTL